MAVRRGGSGVHGGTARGDEGLWQYGLLNLPGLGQFVAVCGGLWRFVGGLWRFVAVCSSTANATHMIWNVADIKCSRPPDPCKRIPKIKK